MIVRSEQRAAADLVVDVFDDRPGQRHAIVGARAASDLVEDHEAAVRGRIQNARRLGHLDHERTSPPRQLVAGTDAGKDAIGDPDGRLASGNEAAHLCHQRQQRDLTNVRTLTGHVRASDQQDHSVIDRGQRVVGHESPLRFADVEHRMAAIDDMQHRFVDGLRAAVSPLARQLGQ